MESGTTGADYRSRLKSIKSLEEAGDAEKAKLERFCLVESLSCLLDRLTTRDNDAECILLGGDLDAWKVFKGSLVTLVKSRDKTRMEVVKRLSPLIERIKPLFRYFDEEELKIFVKEKFLEPRLIKFSNLIKKRNQLLASEVKDLPECEKILSKAISIMLDLDNGRKGDPYSLCPQLAEAYCTRAFCRQEADPKSNSKRIMEDVHCALKIWSAMPKLPKKHLNMLYHIYDFLSLKGSTKHHVMIYEIMLKSFNSNSNDDLKDCCLKLWHSRRLSHTLCGSPVCELFLTKLSNYCGWSDDGETWKSTMDDTNAVGFQHKLALSSHVPYHQDTPVDISINRVEQVATNLIKKDPLSSHSQFVAGHLYYDLAETLIAKGSMIEALFYARKAHKLRRDLVTTMYCMKPKEKTVDGNQEVGSINSYETLNIDQQVAATPWWSHDEVSSDSTNLILTPWNTLQCYLESTLQCGNLEEDVTHAKILLLNGKNISSSHGLSVFSIQFSHALGRFYFKQQNKLAEEETENAQKLWDDVKKDISCLKCNMVLEVPIKQQSGDLYLEKKTAKGIRKALSCYRDVEEKLKHSMWKNKFSSPEEVITRRMFCRESGILSGIIAENDGKSCWHCQGSRITRSMSLQNIGYMKVEYIRRSILIRLLGRIGKCHRLQGDKSSEKKVLFERLSLFVIRSTYNNSILSDDFISKIIDKPLTGFAYTIDYAATIYEICSFFLRNTPKKRNKSKTPRISMEMLVSGLKKAHMLSRQVPTLHQEVSRLLGILYALRKVPTNDNDALSFQQWASYFHQSSIGAYFNNILIARMGKEGHNLMEDNTEGNLEECVLQFFKKLPDFPIICFSIYGENSLLPRNILPDSPTSVWMQLSRLGSDKDRIIIDIVAIESSLEDTVYSDSRFGIPSTEKRNLTAFDKVASVFKSVHAAKDILVKDQSRPESERMEFKRWMKNSRKLDVSLSVTLSDLETQWFSNHKEVFLGKFIELLVDVPEGNAPHSNRSPVMLVMDPEMQIVPWESMEFLRLQDTSRMPSVMSILSTLQSSCSFEETGVFPTVDLGQVYYVLNPQNNLQDEEAKLSPVFETNKFTGLAGRFPSSDLLKEVLKTYEIFLFGGHGSGLSSMMKDISEGLDISSSMVLMACSSGAIKLNGAYNPSGLILDYILSGSPAIASYIWPIRVDDMVMMILSMVKYWRKKRFKTVASSVATARQNCELHYIEGAGFICYGVPTRIVRKRNGQSTNL